MSQSETAPEGTSGALGGRLWRLREGPRADLVTISVFLVALVVGVLNWVGLFVGGVLVGVTAVSTRRALVLSAYLGGAWVLLFVGRLWLAGVLGKAVATGELFGLAVALAVVLPLLGGAVRGLG